MCRGWCIFIGTLSCLFFPTFTLRDYTGYKVLRITPQDEGHFKSLRALREFPIQADVWKRSTKAGESLDAMLSSSAYQKVMSVLEAEKVPHYVMIEDVQRLLEEEKHHITKKSVGVERRNQFDLQTYNRYDEIMSWMKDVADRRPDIATLHEIGQSYEGRKLLVLKLGIRDNKPNVFLECGIHAREWIASAVCLNLISMLADDKETTHESLNMLRKFNWYILPLTNPDGYEYSHTTDRMWRKTRSIIPGAHNTDRNGHVLTKQQCVGVDPNRNFGYMWGNHKDDLDNTCSETYAGPGAFSESETSAVRDFIMSNPDVWHAYVAIHSYGKDILIPWSYKPEFPEDYLELRAVGKAAADAILKATGERYTVGNSGVLMGETAGVSDDWAKGSANIKFSFTIEVRDDGTFGFILPASQIRPTSQDIFAALYAIANNIS